LKRERHLSGGLLPIGVRDVDPRQRTAAGPERLAVAIGRPDQPGQMETGDGGVVDERANLSAADVEVTVLVRVRGIAGVEVSARITITVVVACDQGKGLCAGTP